MRIVFIYRDSTIFFFLEETSSVRTAEKRIGVTSLEPTRHPMTTDCVLLQLLYVLRTCLLITRGIFPCEKNKIELLECSEATDWLLEIDPTHSTPWGDGLL